MPSLTRSVHCFEDDDNLSFDPPLWPTCSLSVLATMQNITVKGVAVCNKKRLGNVHVELYEKDALRPNDFWSTLDTQLEGEFSFMDSYCGGCGCMRVSDYVVPAERLGGVYDMTYVTLDIVVPGESEEC
ncbi:Transthyretin-like family protein [Ostertagia ostertagi]